MNYKTKTPSPTEEALEKILKASFILNCAQSIDAQKGDSSRELAVGAAKIAIDKCIHEVGQSLAELERHELTAFFEVFTRTEEESIDMEDPDNVIKLIK